MKSAPPMNELPFHLRDIGPKLPGKLFPFLIIGTGGIVKNAHLPAYRERALHAAINCQLRFAPFVIAACAMIDRGLICDLTDMEDVIHTMACFEAAYESDRRGGVKPDLYLL